MLGMSRFAYSLATAIGGKILIGGKANSWQTTKKLNEHLFGTRKQRILRLDPRAQLSSKPTSMCTTEARKSSAMAWGEGRASMRYPSSNYCCGHLRERELPS